MQRPDTGELSDQLDLAQRRRPEVRDRKVLLLRLLEAGREAIAREARDRVKAVEETAGALDGVYEAGELERLRVQDLSLGDGAAARLAQLRTDTGRKLRDCCVLLAATEFRGTVASFDSALVEAADSLGLTTLD